MASRRVTIHRLQKPVLGDSNNSKDGSKDNISGEAKKKTKPAGKVVKSQYLQPVDKKPTLKTPANGSTGAQRPASSKPDGTRKLSMNTPPRRSLACQSVLDHMSLTFSGLEPSILGGSKLQSTMLDGHCVRPDFDLSAMKEKMAPQNVEIMEHQAFLLAYLTAKMESNTQKLKSEAEWSLLAVMEEEERLRKRVQEKRRQHLLLEKRRQLSELLDLQSAALAPVSTTAAQFTQEYQTFATAVDAVRHELPVKNFHTQGDKRDFLESAEACLQEGEAVLLGCECGARPESERAMELLQDMKRDPEELEDELSRRFLDVLELVPQVSRQMVQIQQVLEEGRMGTALAQELFHPKQ